jgi:purine-nucleoside phosphorylase
MIDFCSLAHFEEAAGFVRGRTRHEPSVGLVLGSGLGELAQQVENTDLIPYGEIPHWPVSTVEGHAGELHIGELEGQVAMVMRGRTHYYEGYPMTRVTLPVRVMQLMGVHTIILTNAAGGLRSDMQAGQLMLIADHINMIGMGGANPLRGPNDESLGPRFPDMSQVYDPGLRAVARQVALDNGLSLAEGIYVSLAGPSFETPADLRFLRLMGADAVGMSTVPEAIVARHGGLRVLGISGITNIARMETGPSTKTTHEEVLEIGRVIVPRLLALLRGVLKTLPAAK